MIDEQKTYMELSNDLMFYRKLIINKPKYSLSFKILHHRIIEIDTILKRIDVSLSNRYNNSYKPKVKDLLAYEMLPYWTLIIFMLLIALFA